MLRGRSERLFPHALIGGNKGVGSIGRSSREAPELRWRAAGEGSCPLFQYDPGAATRFNRGFGGPLLLRITERKAWRQVEHERCEKRGGGPFRYFLTPNDNRTFLRARNRGHFSWCTTFPRGIRFTDCLSVGNIRLSTSFWLSRLFTLIRASPYGERRAPGR